MPKETVTIAYVNQPKEGKKMGSIKTENGKYFNVYPDKLELFAVGQTYEIEYGSREFQGKMYHNVKSVAPGEPTDKHSASAVNGATDRSNRIERQHSQEMALMFARLKLDSSGQLVTMDELRTLTDWFQLDIGNVSTPAVEQSVEQEPEPKAENWNDDDSVKQNESVEKDW